MKSVLFLSFLITLPALAGKKTQYFQGTIRSFSLDEKKEIAEPLEMTFRRKVDSKKGTIDECLFLKNQFYEAHLAKTKDPLVYKVTEKEKAFEGTVTYADDSLTAWSYDLNMAAPNSGKFTGSLPDKGAKLDEAAGTLRIKLLWKNEYIVLHEHHFITKKEYDKAAQAATKRYKVAKTCL